MPRNPYLRVFLIAVLLVGFIFSSIFGTLFYSRYTLAQRVAATHRLEFWKDAMARPLTERIGPAPLALVELVNYSSSLDGLEEKAYVPNLPPGFEKDLRVALEGLPPQVLSAAQSKLAGIYFMSGFRGSGMADYLLDAKGRSAGGVIMVDPIVFEQRNANQWLSWKENQPFHDDRSGWQLRGVLAAPGEDSRVRALQFHLLHEIAHVLSFGTDLAPPLRMAQRTDPGYPSYPYMNLGWRTKGDSYVLIPSQTLPGRADLRYYGVGKGMPTAEAPTFYAGLQTTSLPTAYGATNPWDDFAEAFATYVHVEIMGRPYQIQLYRNGTLMNTYTSCWTSKRCENRRPFIEAVLRKKDG